MRKRPTTLPDDITTLATSLNTTLFPPVDRLKAILKLALPIMGGMLSQSLINLVDSAMVGALGSTSLAAAGIGGYAAFVITALILGLSSGVQATTAFHFGAGCKKSQVDTLHAGLILAFLLCLPIIALSYPFIEYVLSLLNGDGAVVELAISYLEWRIIALLGVGINLAFRGYWNGMHHSGVYLKIILLIHLSNILISYCLIYGELGLPAMGVEGAGLGTCISIFLGSLAWLIYTLRKIRRQGFLQRLPSLPISWRLLTLSLPNSLQQTLFAMGYLSLFWIIGLIGPLSLAIGHVLVNLSLLMILPAVGLGMAATSMVGKALGQQKDQEAQQWGLDVVKVAVALLCLIAIPLVIFPKEILSLFIIENSGIEYGAPLLQLTALMVIIDAAAIVLTQALLGAGASRLVMMVSVTLQWAFFLPLAFVFGPYLGFGLVGIWSVQLIYRALNASTFIWLWRVKAWTLTS